MGHILDIFGTEKSHNGSTELCSILSSLHTLGPERSHDRQTSIPYHSVYTRVERRGHVWVVVSCI